MCAVVDPGPHRLLRCLRLLERSAYPRYGVASRVATGSGQHLQPWSGWGKQDLAPYLVAFEAVDAGPAHLLVVAEAAGEVVATRQLTFLPGLARRGALRAQVEAVRVRAEHRGTGLGRAVFAWAVGEARRRRCALAQLTSDQQRPEAHRFCEALGFVASHEGFKLGL